MLDYLAAAARRVRRRAGLRQLDIATTADVAHTVISDFERAHGWPRRLDVWAELSAALALWELGAFLQHPRAEHPTLSSLTNTLFQSHVARALGLLMWLGAGTRLARR